jgi:hypothetical protein
MPGVGVAVGFGVAVGLDGDDVGVGVALGASVTVGDGVLEDAFDGDADGTNGPAARTEGYGKSFIVLAPEAWPSENFNSPVGYGAPDAFEPFALPVASQTMPAIIKTTESIETPTVKWYLSIDQDFS